MSARHTPGPWSVGRISPAGVHPGSVVGPDGKAVCQFTWVLARAGSGKVIANAKLIAAAPALADALAKALKELGGTNIMGEELNAALNAEIRAALRAAGRLP